MSRHLTGDNGMAALRLAKEASEALRMSIMVHVGEIEHNKSAARITDILPLMRKGDVLTHCFTGLERKPTGPCYPKPARR
jgi:dihydroorotase